MSNDVLSKMDSNYNLLENVTNKKYAKKILVRFLVGIKANNKETDYDTIFEELSKNDMVSEIAKYALVCSCQQNEELRYPSFVELKEQLLKNNIATNEVIDYLFDNKDLLIRIINDFVELRYDSKEKIKIDYNIKDNEIKRFISGLDSDKEVEEKKSLLGRINNIVFNRSRFDVISNKQVKINRKKYSLGNNMFAFVEKGEQLFYQEDAVLLLEHPNNRNFKMIAVADGDSSKIGGSDASNYTLNKLLRWFESRSSSYFDNIEEIQDSLEKELKKINNRLSNDSNIGATTIALAIVGKTKTLILTIGDSKILLVKDNKIIDETNDDSYVQRLCDQGLVDPKRAKFHKTIDYLMNELGAITEQEVFSKNVRIVPNNYDKLLALTDGVTRLVDNNKIETILKNNENGKVVDELVKASKEDVYIDEIDLYSNNVIKANCNNSTAALYVKRR
jgi:protein phosphatase